MVSTGAGLVSPELAVSRKAGAVSKLGMESRAGGYGVVSTGPGLASPELVASREAGTVSILGTAVQK